MYVFDFIIALAYFAIPLELLYMYCWYPFPVRAKPAIIGCLFVSFITMCGGTHLVRAFNFHTAIPIVTGICTVISVVTALMLVWLIPGLFILAKQLEAERSERLMAEAFRTALREAVDGPDTTKTSLNLIRTVPFCSNRQLRLLTTAKSSLSRMLNTSTLDISSADKQAAKAGEAVVPINHLVVIALDAETYEKHHEMLDRAAAQIADLFAEAGDLILG